MQDLGVIWKVVRRNVLRNLRRRVGHWIFKKRKEVLVREEEEGSKRQEGL